MGRLVTAHRYYWHNHPAQHSSWINSYMRPLRCKAKRSGCRLQYYVSVCLSQRLINLTQSVDCFLHVITAWCGCNSVRREIEGASKNGLIIRNAPTSINGLPSSALYQRPPMNGKKNDKKTPLDKSSWFLFQHRQEGYQDLADGDRRMDRQWGFEQHAHKTRVAKSEIAVTCSTNAVSMTWCLERR